MNLLSFTVPPLLQYIACGHTIFAPGDRHINRRSIRVFDLLFVRKGCLFIGEEDRTFEAGPGSALILRPDCFHFGLKDCMEETEFYWLHFQTTGPWRAAAHASEEPPSGYAADDIFDVRTFAVVLPQFIPLAKPSKADELLGQLVQLHPNAHLSAARLKQQVLFQELVQLLAASQDARRRTSPGKACAERAAALLRSRSREDITVREVGKLLNFHPVYIARCMLREYGCTPKEYLLRYRIEQSKLLLMQTDWSIARIAEEVGFHQAPYFSTCFSRIEGTTPREYRQLFH